MYQMHMKCTKLWYIPNQGSPKYTQTAIFCETGQIVFKQKRAWDRFAAGDEDSLRRELSEAEDRLGLVELGGQTVRTLPQEP
jgi:hypothetical protein